MLLRAFLCWIVLAFLETGHGILRGKFLAPRVGDHKSRQIGVASGSILILAFSWIVFPWLGLKTPVEAFQVGAVWLVCMLAFELTVGHFVFRLPCRLLGKDFNPFQGGFLALGMLILAAAPWFAGQLRGAW